MLKLKIFFYRGQKNFLGDNTMMIQYEEKKEFQNDFKDLLKKFPSLKEDFEINKQYRIELFHNNNTDNNSIEEIKGVGNTKKLRFFKITKFQCKSLKGRGAKSGIRLIYAFFPELKKIVFLEIYFKAQQTSEKKQRIIDFKKIIA